MSDLLDCRFSIAPDVLFQEVSGDTVLLDLGSEKYFGLDPIGSRVWQAIADGQTVREALGLIMNEYQVSQAQLECDVIALLGQLQAAGLLLPGNSAD